MRYARLLVGVVVLSQVITSAWAQTPQPMEVGRTTGDQLAAILPTPQPTFLPSSSLAGIPGFAGQQPAISGLTVPRIPEGIFPISTSSQVEMVLVSADPGVFLFDELGLRPLSVGESFFLGGPGFTVEPIWAMPFAVRGDTASLQVQFRDRMGALTNSPVMTLRFIADTPCYVNCNGDRLPTGLPRLDVQDFVCFQNRFALNDAYANCNGDKTPTGANKFDVLDFVCFQNQFALGCR